VPEPGDLEKCQNVDFEQEKGLCVTLSKELEDVKKKTDLIGKTCAEDIKEPFHERFSSFIVKGEEEIRRLEVLLDESKRKFLECMQYYKFSPKKGKLEDAKPEEFFSIWFLFADEFKNIWKKEQRRIEEEMVKEARKKEKEKRSSIKSNIETKKTPVGGIKEKLQKRRGLSRSNSISFGSEDLTNVEDSKPTKALTKATMSLVELPVAGSYTNI
jgi:formin 2